MGSKRPLAKRKARMLSAASLPRKWSMRKICSSSNVACSVLLSAPRAGEVGAEGLLHDDPRPLGEIGLPEELHHVGGGCRRHAQVVQPAHVVAELALERAHRVATARRRLRSARRNESLAANSFHWSSGTPWCANSSSAARGERAEARVVVLVERRPDDAALGQQTGLRQVEEARQQLAARQVAGRAEQHHDVGPERRDERRADVGGLGCHAVIVHVAVCARVTE